MSTLLNIDNYNEFQYLPELPYNCIKYLMDNDEETWKMLNYSTADCWEKPNLSKTEKGALIYDGLKKSLDCRVFIDRGLDDSWTAESCILRVSVLEVVPTNYVYGFVTIGFEIYSHYKCVTLSNYTSRLDAMAQRIISVFNGAEIGGLGVLYFNARATGRCKLTSIGSTPYRGKAVVMCNRI